MRRAVMLILLLAGCRAAPPQRLVVAYPTGPESLRPDANNDEYTTSILNNAFEPLVDFGPELQLRPLLADAWHVPDDLTWVFDLKPDVRLHDGRLLTAQDVARSLEHARSDPASRRQAELLAVASIEAPDAHRLVVHTRYPFAALPNRLASVPVWVEPSQPGGFPLGTGPYRIERWTSGGETELAAFDGHSGEPPRIARMLFRVVPEGGQQIEMLARGDLDLIADVALVDLPRLRAMPGIEVRTQRGLLVLFLAMDCAREHSPYVQAATNPLRDARVRRAIAFGIDRRTRIREQLSGQAVVVDQIVGPEVSGYHDSLPPWPFDPQRSRQLLAEAGFGHGFAMDLDYLGGEADEQDALVQAIAADLGKIGIQVTPRPRETAELLKKIESRDTSFYVMPWISNSGDAGLSAEYLLHSPGGGYGVDNGGGYSDAELDLLLEQASRSLRASERSQLLMKVAERLHAEVPVIPLCVMLDRYAARKGLHFEPRLDRQIRGKEISRQ